jgi:hypothetical protein
MIFREEYFEATAGLGFSAGAVALHCGCGIASDIPE